LTAIVIGLGAAVYLLATAVAAFGTTGRDDLGDD
jgi:multisubunit Na+/H+ antiporter MnhC subunit